MKKIFLITIFLFVTANSFAQTTTCHNTKLPLDELRYMDKEELNIKYCGAKTFQDLYMQKVQLGDYSSMDAVGVCSGAASLIAKVLKREHDSAPPDCD